jgi:hypothetical protein
MAVRGDEVASSIDAHVREEIERMVGEIRSSVDDIRVTVDSQLKAALQSVQADVKSLSFLPHIQKAIGDFGDQLSAEQPPPVAAPVAPPTSGQLRTAILQVERGKSQVDILNALLEQCLGFGSRAALLILRGDTFSGWKGVGFNDAGGSDEAIKRFNAAPGLIAELDTIVRDERVVSWDGANLSTRFGVGPSERAILIPMVIKDKVAAAVYVDAVSADVSKLDSGALQILVFATGLLIDTLAIRKKVPSPSLNDPAADSQPASAPPPARPAAAQPAAAAPTPAPQPAAAPPAVTPRPTFGQQEAQSSDPTLSMPSFGSRSATPGFNIPASNEFGGGSQGESSSSFKSSTEPGTRVPAAAAPAPAASAPAHGSGSDDRPSTQYVPPAGLARGGALGGNQSEEAKRHDEARRFARLLVSEIKLYNESKVDAGRKNRDLYERLKEDIDRSRQMYDERIPDDVRKTSNYFYDELVRILADGNAALLGL